jgi:hypothetical protein
LGKWLQIENKEHSEFGHLFQAIEFRQNSQFSAARLLMVFKWSSPGTGNTQDSSALGDPPSVPGNWALVEKRL